MQLVRIHHIRYLDNSATTFALVPDDWSEKEVQNKLNRAQDKYFEAVRIEVGKQEEEAPRVVHSFAQYVTREQHMHDDKTIRELRKEYEEARDEYLEWQKKEQATRARFISFLIQEGFVTLWDTDQCIEAKLDWGHKHGMALTYHEGEDIDTMPTPEEFVDALKRLS